MSIIYRKTTPASERRAVQARIIEERRLYQKTRRAKLIGLVRLMRSMEANAAQDAAQRQVEAVLQEGQKIFEGGYASNVSDLLPALFNLNGKPYRMDNHFPFEPIFNTHISQNIVWKTGRQVGKSSGQGAQLVLLSALIAYFNTLVVTPLFEMVRRFSSQYVKQFIDDSPVRYLMTDATCSNNVLQRSFKNRSTLYFSFCFTDCDRTRGIPASRLVIDELQDMDGSFIPILKETVSASTWKLTQMTGTPKTLENAIEKQWLSSSMAEWVIPCGSCRKHNIPTLSEDLEKMLGPYVVTREISDQFPALVCAKCGKPVDSREGYWFHSEPSKRLSFSGYHIPQCIMPMHYADPEAWALLQGKRQGFGMTPTNVFHNEVLGESSDHGAKLITDTDLKAAAKLPENTLENAKKRLDSYTDRFLSVDWGGGGMEESSFTTIALIGRLPDGRIEVPFGYRSLTPNEPIREALLVLRLLQEFRCSRLVHDFGGAGALRETVLSQSGYPEQKMIPVSYTRVGSGAMMRWIPFSELTGKRAYYQLDKARSLEYTCQLIQQQWIQFFKYDWKSTDEAGLLRDFLTLVREHVDSRMGQDLVTIIRNEVAGPDDFAQAVNIGVCAMFYAHDSWPDVAKMVSAEVSQELLDEIDPGVKKVNWDDL